MIRKMHKTTLENVTFIKLVTFEFYSLLTNLNVDSLLVLHVFLSLM